MNIPKVPAFIQKHVPAWVPEWAVWPAIVFGGLIVLAVCQRLVFDLIYVFFVLAFIGAVFFGAKHLYNEVKAELDAQKKKETLKE